jgi:hypothetical protein
MTRLARSSGNQWNKRAIEHYDCRDLHQTLFQYIGSIYS